MDDPDSLTAYGAADPYPPGDWRSWIVEIRLPFERGELRLETQKTKAVTATRCRTRAKKAE